MWLIVQGRDPARVRSVFERALSLAPRFLPFPSRETRIDQGTAAAAFGRVLGEAPAFAHGAPQGEPAAPRLLAASAGAWLLRAASDEPRAAPASGEAALRSLGAALREGDARFAEIASRLDGFFALVAADPVRGELAVATDRNGTLHAYRAEHEGCALVSTSALLLGAVLGAPLRREAVAEFLATGSVFEERSLLEGVEKLPPASVLRFREGRLVARTTWWDLGAALAARPPRDPVGALAEALRDAVDAVLARHPRAVLDLTGGFDSRGVVAAALATGRPFRTVVVGAADDPDVRAARRIALALGLEHAERPREAPESAEELDAALRLTDGECGLGEYAMIARTHRAMSAAGAGASVNGTAGELCRGYWWDLLSRGAPLDPRRAARGRFATEGWADAMLGGAPPAAEHFAGVVARAIEPYAGLPGTAQADAVYLRLRMERWAGRLASSTDRLWPCLSPFLFRGPLEAALAAPVASRRRDRMARALVERLHPALAALPMANGAPALPLRLATLPRFLPLAVEVAGKVAHRARRRLGRARAAGRGASGRGAAAPGGTDAGTDEPPADAAWEGCAALHLAGLDPQRLLTRGLYAPDALDAFLRRAQAGGLAARQRLDRIATLESLARAIAGA